LAPEENAKASIFWRNDLLTMTVMHQRLAAIFALAAFGLLILLGINARPSGPADNGGRVSFQIATGPSGGTFFTVGQAIAGLISHPPGVGRCQTSTVCGPSGVILSTRTSQGSIDSVTAVDRGLIDSALVQADTLAAAMEGSGPFRRLGRQRHLRVIAALFIEPLQLVVRADSPIHEVRDLARRRVYLGGEETGAAVTARKVLSAFGVLGASRRVESDDPAADLAAGKIDAYFVLASAPFPPVAQAVRSGGARLVPIEGPEALRLLQGEPQLQVTTIVAPAYGVAVPTIATRAVWVVQDRASDALVYGLARALFNPANHEALAASDPAAGQIMLSAAVFAPPAPLHPGAARYYREVGRL
jgi:TRAP transporter TAXI family solute receptor